MLQRSRKLSHSGFRIAELYVELQSALLAQDPERACSLTAELSCTPGHSRCVVSVLLDTYCARCVNSGRAQLNLLGSSLSYIGDGTSRSPHAGSCHEAAFRRGLCTLTLLVACSSDPSKNVTTRFARVPRAEHVPTLEMALSSLRVSILQRDAQSMSAVVRAVPDEAWFGSKATVASKLDCPDVQRLCASARRETVWDLWGLARSCSLETGVSEYVDTCLKAFSWGYCPTSRKSRITLLWYALLVVIKGAPRAGPHPIDLKTFENAIASVDALFDGILSCRGRAETSKVEDQVPDLPVPVPLPVSVPVPVPVHDVASYLYMISPVFDQVKAWEVEKDRQAFRLACTQTRCVDIGTHRR